jgi:hypothetical protein
MTGRSALRGILATGLGLGLLSVGVAWAQDDADGCPQISADTGLTWEYRGNGDMDFCRALRDDGSEAFGLYIAKKTPFEPKKGKRAETGHIDGQEVTWYRGELAGKPDFEVRETLLPLADGRVVHIWMQAPNQQELRQVIRQAETMQFPATRLSSK